MESKYATGGPVTRPPSDAEYRVRALESVLADRERELLELKGPCSGAQGKSCRLHYAHSGPCDMRESRSAVSR